VGAIALVSSSAGAALGAPAGGGGDGGADLVGDQAETETLGYQDTIDLSIEDIQAFWTVTFPEVFGIEYEEISDILPYDSDTSARNLSDCAEGASYEDIANNAFYCPVDDTVSYDDENLFPDFYDNYGNFSIAMALAHEWGHAVQGRVAPEVFTGGIPSVFSELQADCYAGAWTSWVESGESGESGAALELEEGDLEAGIAGLLAVRDPTGTDPSDESQVAPHGSGFDRVNAFQEGLEQGAARCAQYFEAPPVVTEFPFTSEQDLASGGNLPYADSVDLFTQDLDVYWTLVFDASSLTYDGIDDVERYNPKKEGTLPECDALGLDPDRPKTYRSLVFYCPGEEFIAYDTTFLKQVHREIGDNAVALLVSNAWADGMQEDLGDEPDSAVSDCFSGSWAGSIGVDIDGDFLPDYASNGLEYYREAEPLITSSPGDLDEVVISFLSLGEAAEVEATGLSAFSRLQNFRTGFFSGEEACADLAG
jgi:predicted metalloprotease